MLFDEGDEYILERPGDFHRRSKGHPVVALTATPGSHGTEKVVLEELNFSVKLTPPKDLQQGQLKVDDEISLAAFTKMLSELEEPMLIFCNQEQIDSFKRDGAHFTNEQITGEDAGASQR